MKARRSIMLASLCALALAAPPTHAQPAKPKPAPRAAPAANHHTRAAAARIATVGIATHSVQKTGMGPNRNVPGMRNANRRSCPYDEASTWQSATHPVSATTAVWKLTYSAG